MKLAIWNGEISSQLGASVEQQTCQVLGCISEVENVPDRLPIPSSKKKRNVTEAQLHLCAQTCIVAAPAFLNHSVQDSGRRQIC